MSGQIRLVSDADVNAIHNLYASYVRDTVISFELAPPTVDEMAERIHRTLQVYPWLVYGATDGSMAGYVYASKHRERAAYQWSVDVTAYLYPRFHRLGIGRGLYTSLFAILRLQGFYNAYAGIALPNDASIGVHIAVGFEPVGVYTKVGYKFAAWHDVAWLGLSLQPPRDDPSPPIPLPEVIKHPLWTDALNAGLPLIRVAQPGG